MVSHHGYSELTLSLSRLVHNPIVPCGLFAVEYECAGTRFFIFKYCK